MLQTRTPRFATGVEPIRENDKQRRMSMSTTCPMSEHNVSFHSGKWLLQMFDVTCASTIEPVESIRIDAEAGLSARRLTRSKRITRAADLNSAAAHPRQSLPGRLSSRP
jgi:hypothetical protein